MNASGCPKTARTVLLAWLAWTLYPHAAPQAAEEARLLRFPAIHGDKLAFTYAGDLYAAPVGGGVARKLTSHVGDEMFARFSPDGTWIAFTGQYDGNTEAYVMPAAGGVPQRLTFTPTLARDDVADRMGPNNIVLGWRDENTVLFRCRGFTWNPFHGQLLAVSRDGGLPKEIPVPRGGWCSFSPDKKRMAYNRVFREFRTWKGYRGGQADDIWIYDFDTKALRNLTNNPAQDVFPMWHGDQIYFVSDRDELKRMNLYVHDLTMNVVRKLTDFKDYDVKFPSLGDDAIVFENGGYIYRFDLKTQQAHKIPITIQEDLAVARGGLREVGKEVVDFGIAPDGSRAVFGARGDVFTVPAKHGNTRNLTNTPGVHERAATWSPDGKWIAYISDASGEDEIYIMAQNGAAAAVQLTTGGDTYKYRPLWSPDSQRLLWSDKKQRLQMVEMKTKAVTLVAQATAWEISDYQWSPDGQWIAFTKPEERRMAQIYLYSLAEKALHPVTDGWFADSDPAFSADGKYLFFTSRRNFRPQYGQTEWNHVYVDMEGIYLVTLAKGTPSPFAPKSDEVKLAVGDPAKPDKPKEGDEAKKDAPAEQKSDKKPAVKKVVVKVDPDGLVQRIVALPVAASNYSHLTAVGDRLFYLRHGNRERESRLFCYDLDKQKETELGTCSGYKISADGKKLLVHAENAYAIIDLPAAKFEIKDRLDLSELKVVLNRGEEWRQIFQECWRQMRDFVYDPNLHHIDWPAMRARYEPLVAHVSNREDLTYVIGEMIGELNLGHCYVGGGDYPKAPRTPVGLLGAKLERDPKSGYIRIQKILKGQNWDKALRAPLTEIGVNVKEGEFIIAVDGKPTNQMKNIYEALVGTAGKQVTLKINAQPKPNGSRQVVVVPTAEESHLYYLNWVLGNIERVSKATDGRIGYVHIPDMGAEGLNEFAKLFYPQTDKEGLIVDVRGNGGGNVSPQIIERLRREPAMFTIARNAGVNVDPTGTVLGPKVMLLDEYSASDGDIVAYRFKKYKLGPVVGKRSWGGVVGIRGTLPLLDGGYLMRPEFSRFDLEGKEWIMEGKGVEPDIVVDNDPAHEYAGVDDQLEKAIAVIKQELAKRPVKLPAPPPYPDKSK